jgi:hypothetical protein
MLDGLVANKWGMIHIGLHSANIQFLLLLNEARCSLKVTDLKLCQNESVFTGFSFISLK